MLATTVGQAMELNTVSSTMNKLGKGVALTEFTVYWEA